MKSPTKGSESVHKTDIQNNTHQLPHSWDYYSGTSQTDYELDGVGNRKTVIRDGQTETYVTNTVNEYIYVNNKRLMYDQNGNLTQWNDKTLHYNHNNQLVEVTYTEGGFDWDWWFRYGVLGRRMTESFSNGLVYHRNLWNDGQMVIYEESDGYKYRYYNGNLIDEVLCREDQFGSQIWYLTDALGSVYVLTDNASNVIEAYQYDIYGEPRVYASDGTPRDLTNYDNRLLFTSREYVWQLHLYYYRFRWYNPTLGCFSQRDPVRRQPKHVYTECAPTLWVDPLGTQKQKKEEEEFKCESKVSIVLSPGGQATQTIERKCSFKVTLVNCSGENKNMVKEAFKAAADKICKARWKLDIQVASP